MNLAINNVTNLCNFVGKMVCVCVSLSVYLELLTHFLPFKIHLTNIKPILIKMVDFKNLAWATSFANRASRIFIYLPYRASGEKSYCHTLPSNNVNASLVPILARQSHSWLNVLRLHIFFCAFSMVFNCCSLFFNSSTRFRVTVAVFVLQIHNRNISVLKIIKPTDFSVIACDWLASAVKPIRS